MACLTQVWTADHSEQETYIANLFLALSEIDSAYTTITLYQNTEPSTSDLLDAYEAQTGLATPPIGVSFAWFDPTTEVIENHYRVVDDIADDVTSGNPVPYTEKDRSLDFVFLEEVYALDDTAAASMFIDSISQDYSHLFITSSIRSTVAAATDNINIRVNTIATANYASERTNMDGAAVTCTPGISQTALADTGGAVGNTTAQPSSYSAGYMFIFNYATITGFNFGTLARRSQWSGASPIVAAARDFAAVYSVVNAAITPRPVTRIDFISPATSKRGSKFSIYGMN